MNTTKQSTSAVEELKYRVLAEGKNLGNNILKVDSIINHQVDPRLMSDIGKEFASRFSHTVIDKVLTAEISGISPAVMTGLALNVPVVYARKHRPITMSEPIYLETSVSPTKQKEVQLMVSHEFIMPGERILIVDDFLASGQTLHALARIIETAEAELVGIACVIEKGFQNGRQYLSEHVGDIQVESAVVITALEGNSIQVAE